MKIEKNQRTTTRKYGRATTRVAPYHTERAERVPTSYSRVRPSWSPVGLFPRSPIGNNGLFVLVGVVLVILALWSYMSIVSATHETLDQHVYRIGAQLKCPICQGESVAASSSTLAQQMRAIIREKVQAGQSDQQIIQFFSDRYGEQIVWAPQWWGFSLLAWFVPIALLLGGLVLIFFTLRAWRTPVVSGVAHATGNTERIGENGRKEQEAGDLDEDELTLYRMQLERELASDDILFERADVHHTQSEVH